jgi:hypothetical protein
MDLYITSLALGAAGLGFMALSGLGTRGHGGAARAHAGAQHGGHHGVIHAHHASHVHQHHAPHHAHQHMHAEPPNPLARTLWTLASPRFLFSFLFGLGLTGQILRAHATGGLLLAGSLLGAVVFERALVAPLWEAAMRFASKPAQTLDSAVADEAIAVTSFDGNGQGIVSVEVDGQIVQILATLQPSDRQLGVRVRAGQRVRIEDVNAAANQCTVSLL